MQFNAAHREIVLKVVYYGPPLSGKTTNLQALNELVSPGVLGHLTTLNTADDRTLFFDVLPVIVTSESGFSIKLKLFTVPGQVVHAATRRLVLSGADGVVFVADSQLSEARLNNEYWHGMRRYLAENGLDADAVPTVIQFNKRDLPDIRTDDELEHLRRHSPEPLYTAIAVRGEGVRETLAGLLDVMFKDLDRRYEFSRKFRTSGDHLTRAMFALPGSGGAYP